MESEEKSLCAGSNVSPSAFQGVITAQPIDSNPFDESVFSESEYDSDGFLATSLGIGVTGD